MSCLMILLSFLYSFVHHRDLHSFPTRRSSDLVAALEPAGDPGVTVELADRSTRLIAEVRLPQGRSIRLARSDEHTSELQSRQYLVCSLLLEKKENFCLNKINNNHFSVNRVWYI